MPAALWEYGSSPAATSLLVAQGRVPDSLADLQSLVDEFVHLGAYRNIPPDDGLHLSIALTHRLIQVTRGLEAQGLARQTLLNVLHPARRICAESPFARRLQEWPRGYPGDFETVEYIVRQRNRAEAGRLAWYIEQYALGSPIAQQHRNKVDLQAREILSIVLGHARAGDARILMLAAGGSPDLRQIQTIVGDAPFAVTLLDQDEEALAFSACRLTSLGDRLSLVCANVIRGLSGVAKRGPFDLVLAGGLFDYLSDRVAIAVLRQVRTRLLRDGGRLLFTNIGATNPYRAWIEYMGDWFLIHRSEADVLALCAAAGFSNEAVTIDVDRTGLTLIVTVQL